MPESRIRRKKAYTAPTGQTSAYRPNGPWFVPTMVGLLIAGLAWVVVFYVSESRYPIPDIGAWNLVCGFAVMLLGFGLATRWR
jgi:hypothetical protein